MGTGQCDYPSLYFFVVLGPSGPQLIDGVVLRSEKMNLKWASCERKRIFWEIKTSINLVPTTNWLFFSCKNIWWGIYIRTIKSWHLMIGANWQEVPFCPTFANASLPLIDWLTGQHQRFLWMVSFIQLFKVASTKAVRAQGLGFFSSNLHSLSRHLS